MFYEKILFQSLCFKISHLKFGPGKIIIIFFFRFWKKSILLIKLYLSDLKKKYNKNSNIVKIITI